eukprot:15334598-Ditylum_brightwellii.AAC.1
MAQTKQTPRTGVYEKLDVVPKDNKPEEEDDAPKGPSFEDDVNKTNKLGKKTNSKYKLDDKIDSGDDSNDDYVEGDEGSKKFLSEGHTEEEDSRNSQVDYQGDEDMSRAAGLLVLSTSESNNNNK